MIELQHNKAVATWLLAYRRRETKRARAICLTIYVGKVCGITFSGYGENKANWRSAREGTCSGFAFIRLVRSWEFSAFDAANGILIGDR